MKQDLGEVEIGIKFEDPSLMCSGSVPYTLPSTPCDLHIRDADVEGTTILIIRLWRGYFIGSRMLCSVAKECRENLWREM